MSSYKCPQCGLINWNTAEVCKRCTAPNPFLTNSIPANFQPQAPAQNTQMYSQQAPAQNQPSMYPQEQYPPQNAPGYYQQQPQYAAASPNYSAPPPPNVFGANAGYAENAGAGNWQQPIAQNRTYQSQAYDPQAYEKLEAANKKIKSAWITGFVIAGITIALSFVVSSRSQQINTAAPLDQDSGSLAMGMFIFAVITGALSLGIMFKNRACAVILLVLFSLDKLVTFGSMGSNVNPISIIVALAVVAALIGGVSGTFEYHKLTKDQKAY